MGVITGPCVIKAGTNGCRIIVKSDDKETLIRVIEPYETCEVYFTPLIRKKVD